MPLPSSSSKSSSSWSQCGKGALVLASAFAMTSQAVLRFDGGLRALQTTKVPCVAVGIQHRLVEADAMVVIDVEIVTSYPGDVSALPLFRQGGEITSSISRVCFEGIILIPAVIEAPRATSKSMVKYVLEVHWAPPDLERLV